MEFVNGFWFQGLTLMQLKHVLAHSYEVDPTGRRFEAACWEIQRRVVLGATEILKQQDQD